MNKTPNGYTIWEGASPVDGAPIVCVIVKSGNRKTGRSWQTWIMRADIHPNEALKGGEDRSVCGDCPHRPRTVNVPEYRTAKGRKVKARIRRVRTCYVGSYVIASVWKAWKRGDYPNLPDAFDFNRRIAKVGDFIRLGAYGDPALVPYVINYLLVDGLDHAGYTHQWDKPWFDKRYLDLLMCSTDTEEQLAQVKAMGARAFHVSTSDLPKGVGLCPASDAYKTKTGKGLTCSACKLCNGKGTRANSMGIAPHGTSGARYLSLNLVNA